MALKIDAAKWRRRRGVGRVLDALGAADGLTRYVGGAIRDDFLDHKVSDLDLATKILPDEVMERLVAAKIKAVPTGIDHGTITAVSDGKPVEITTLRRDVSTDGRRATVAFTDDWSEDAARRDFTINALSADPVTGEIFDYFGGLEDLEGRHIRFIGDPLKRIAEDHLRILRFFRFHARFGSGELDAAALDACTERANDLMALSRERIADELIKLLGMDDPAPTVAIMLDRGILKPVLAEIVADRLGDLSVPEYPGIRHAVVVGEGTAEPRVRRVLGSRPHVVARGLGLDADGILVGLPALPRAAGVEADSGGDHVHGARAREHQMRERAGEILAPVADDGERGGVAGGRPRGVMAGDRPHGGHGAMPAGTPARFLDDGQPASAGRLSKIEKHHCPTAPFL